MNPILEEVELTEKSVQKATKFVNSNYSKENQVEYSIVLNTFAHGYYMGWRFGETYYEPKFWHAFFPRKRPWSHSALWNESSLASQSYVDTKNLRNLPQSDFILVQMTCGQGFRDGFRDFETQSS